MTLFDRVETAKLDRRELQLWVLAITVILVLATGMALLMYPTAFLNPLVLAGVTLRKAFFGFCALSVLLVGYLIDRQIAIHQLRQRLAEEHNLILRIRNEASADLLRTLPGLEHFQDRLVMEHRRASRSGQPLSVVAVRLMPARGLGDTREAVIAYGDAAKAMTRKLRVGDSLYRFATGLFSLVLPGLDTDSAYRLADRLADGLGDASGACSRFTFEVRVFNHPENAATARELEDAVRSFFTCHGDVDSGILDETLASS
jgi:GGDEF domain-containing protein